MLLSPDRDFGRIEVLRVGDQVAADEKRIHAFGIDQRVALVVAAFDQLPEACAVPGRAVPAKLRVGGNGDAIVDAAVIGVVFENEENRPPIDRHSPQPFLTQR